MTEVDINKLNKHIEAIRKVNQLDFNEIVWKENGSVLDISQTQKSLQHKERRNKVRVRYLIKN